MLRETAQTPEEDLASLQDVGRHRYVNTNNLWVGLEALRDTLQARDGVLGLPIIVNRKTVDPSDPTRTPVVQLETAMGAAIGVFEGARALHVPRRRFAPVKTTNDLLALRSDAYVLRDDRRVELAPDARGAAGHRPRRRLLQARRRLRAPLPGGAAVAGGVRAPDRHRRRDLRARRRGPRHRHRGGAGADRGWRRTDLIARISGGAPSARSGRLPHYAPVPSLRHGTGAFSTRVALGALLVVTRTPPARATKSQASAMPMTIDCSRAMIAPASAWSSPALRPQIGALVLVERVERVGGEGDGDAEDADEQLRREHVDHGAHAGQARAASGSATCRCHQYRTPAVMKNVCSRAWTSGWRSAAS